MLETRIPTRLQEKLTEYPEVHGGVRASIAQFEPWISSGTPPFFPESRDHGITRLESVLATVEALIRDEAWPILTPSDAAALVLAVLLRDAAMHLTDDGFVALLQSEEVSPPPGGYDVKAWPLLWREFLAEASGWDERRSSAVLGDTRPVRAPILNPPEMTERDRRSIGEFLRRHHHRLAHEIALHGVPGPQAGRFKLLGLPPWLGNLSGLIARSHGVPLRDCFPFLERNFSLREFRGVRAPFLMVVLRVADYLQVQAERAPGQGLQVRRIRSPLSSSDWDGHPSILEVHNPEVDPEALYIAARPPTVEAYLELRAWETAIQSELDVGWAVLGEVYGRSRELSGLGLTIRRIRSSLDHLER